MKFIKKHKNKLFILMLTLISALTLFLNVGKTYAYKTDRISYTLQNWYASNTYTEITTTSEDNYIDAYKTESGGFVVNITFNIIDQNVNDLSNYSILINYGLLIYDNIYTSNTQYNLAITPSGSTSGTFSYNIKYNNYLVENNKTYRTFATTFNDNSNTTISNHLITFNFRVTNSQPISNNYVGIRIYNIDLVKNDEIYTQDYIDTYYEPLEQQYEQLLQNYNNLNNDYTTLEGNYNTLQDDYNTLEDDYNTLEDVYNNLGNVYSSLWNNIPYYALANDIYDYSYSGNFSTFVQHYNADVYTIEEMQNENIINGSTLNFANLTNSNIYNDIYNLGIYFNSSYNGNEWRYLLPTEEINISCNVPIGLNNNNKIVLTFKRLLTTMRVYDLSITYNDLASNNYMINKELINKIDNTFDFEIFNYLDSIHIICDKTTLQNATFNLNSISSNYYQGYTIGFDEGYNAGRTTQENIDNESINALENNIRTLNDQIENSRQDIIRQQQLIQALNDQIASISYDYNLNNLMWTIASTPFESFKQIWNVNFLGVNITQMVTGLLTAFIVLYIVKKFFL